MQFILIELVGGTSEIIPTRLISGIRIKENYDDEGKCLAHKHCYIFVDGSDSPFIVNHTISALRDKLGAA